MLLDFKSALATASFSTEVRLFVAAGSADHEFRPNVEAFMRALTEKPVTNLNFQTLVLEGLGHAPIAGAAFYYGIEAVYT